jgi:hypothetical protein
MKILKMQGRKGGNEKKAPPSYFRLQATVETRRWTRRSLSGKKRRRDEGEDDGTGESQKTSSSSFYFKPHCVVWSL